MANEHYKTNVLRHFNEALNQGHLHTIEEIYAPEYVLHAPVSNGDTRGHDQLKERVVTFRTGFPDIHFSVDQMIAEGNSVSARYTFRGTHTGQFGPLAPTGKWIEVPGIIVFRFDEKGLMHEGWSCFDSMDMMQQLGLGPA